MAVTVTQVRRRNDYVEYDVIATADADTDTGAILHLMGANPRVTIIPLLQVSAGLSLWAITTLSNTTVTATKSVAVGSGNAGAQLRIRVERDRG